MEITSSFKLLKIFNCQYGGKTLCYNRDDSIEVFLHLEKLHNTEDTGSNPNSATAGILLSVVVAHWLLLSPRYLRVAQRGPEAEDSTAST